MGGENGHLISHFPFSYLLPCACFILFPTFYPPSHISTFDFMLATFALDIQPTAASRIAELDPNNMVFGQLFADHMLTAEYVDGAWQSARIAPYGQIGRAHV